MGEHDQREDFPEAYVGQFLFKNLKERKNYIFFD